MSVQRMQREQRCNERRRPEASCEPPQDVEQQQRVYDMQQQVGEVETAGVQGTVVVAALTIDCAVEHQRQPGDGVPVAGVPTRQRPLDRVFVQAGPDVTVFEDINVIVEVHEIVAEHLYVDQNIDDDQRGVDQPHVLLADSCRPLAPG